MNRLYLLGAVGGSFLIGLGLGSYLAKPAPVLNYHTPVTPAKEETDKEDTAEDIVDDDEDRVLVSRGNPILDRNDNEDEEGRTPYHTYMDMEEEVDILPPDPNDPDLFDPYMADIEVVGDREEWLSKYSEYKTIHLRSFAGQGIVIDESNMILPLERVKDLVGDWVEWIETGDTASEVTLYNHRLNYRVYLELVTEMTYADFREDVHHGRSGE